MSPALSRTDVFMTNVLVISTCLGLRAALGFRFHWVLGFNASHRELFNALLYFIHFYYVSYYYHSHRCGTKRLHRIMYPMLQMYKRLLLLTSSDAKHNKVILLQVMTSDSAVVRQHLTRIRYSNFGKREIATKNLIYPITQR